MLNIAVVGASGRMGQALIRLINANPQTALSGAMVRKNSDKLGIDAGANANIAEVGIKLSDDIDNIFKNCALVIDFTPAGSTAEHLAKALQYNTKIVIGSTGLSQADEDLIKQYSNHIAIVYATNFSIGVNTLFAICEKIGATLDSQKFEVHIDETHHIHKIDAPSGTALSLGKEIAKARNVNFNDVYKYQDNRNSNDDITFSDNREGEVIGDHTVSFNGNLESLHLTHNAHNRDVFADGAVQAGIWLADKKAGLYNMRDVLKLK